MSYKHALAAFAIFIACGPALAQPQTQTQPQTPTQPQTEAQPQTKIDEPPASAQPGPPPRTTTTTDRDACGNDVQKFCSEVVNPRPGDTRVLACLIKHEKEISEACQKNIASHKNATTQQ